MYRLTVRASLLNKSALPTTAPSQQQRVYRWGPNWAVYRAPLQPNRGGTWRAEKRSILESTSDQLFECVEVLDVQAPPVRVDDVWDEEIVVSNNVEYNGLVSICANAAEIKRWCLTNKISVLKALDERAATDPVAAPRQPPSSFPSHHQGRPQQQQYHQQQGRPQQQHSHIRPPTAPRSSSRPSMCLIDS